MIRRVYLGAAVLSGILAACTVSNDVAGSSMETENSIAYSAVLADGTPAARMKVRVRPADFVAAGSGLDVLDSSRFTDGETDDRGFVALKNLESGDYRIEVGDGSLKGTDEFVVKTEDGKIVTDSLQVTVDKVGRILGQVELAEGQLYAWVAVVGLDYYAKTDSLGNFEFESLPAGDFSVLAMTKSFHSINSAVALVDAGESVNVLIELPEDTIPKDTVPKDTLKHFVFEDFENGVDDWYVNHSPYGEGEISAELDSVRESMVAYFNSRNDSNAHWVLMGRGFSDQLVDMSDVDSVVFWARGVPKDGADKVYLEFSFDSNVDSVYARTYGKPDSTAFVEKFGQSGKAWVRISLNEDWNRYVVRTDSLLEPDSVYTGGNIGWDLVKDRVTDLSVFGGVGGQIWVDDIEIFGSNEFVGRKIERLESEE